MKRVFLFTMMCLFGFLGSICAQSNVELNVGDSQYITGSLPNYEYYNYSISQQIYTAEEMQGLSGSITSIAFKQASSSQYTRNFAIYMLNTDVEKFEGYSPWLTCTAENLVFEGDVNYPGATGEWMEIQFQNAFEYTGGNVLLCVCDNTGNWMYDAGFYAYSTGSVKRAIYTYRDDYGAYNPDGLYAGTYSVQDWYVDSYAYFNNQVKFGLQFEGELVSIKIEPKTIDLGDRPNGAWMRPFEVVVSTRNEDLNIIAVESSNTYFQLSEMEMPTTITKANPLTLEITHNQAEGNVEGAFVVAYNDSRSVEMLEMTAFAYTPVASDVWETAEVIASYPFSVTPDLATTYDNYLLPGDAEDGRDVVYVMNIEKDVLLSANVEGENGKVAVYTEDFGGKEGPMADNNYNGPQVTSAYNRGSQIESMILPAGKYYIAASSTSDFTVNINTELIPVPEQAAYPVPANQAQNISNPILSWSFGDYTVEYQVLFGTAYPPVDVVIDWTDDLQVEHIFDVNNNLNYFWQVNVRNTSGVTYGDIWAFTTSFNTPKNLTASSSQLYEGESTTIYWDAVSERTYRGYNVYVDNQKVNKSLLHDLTFTLDNLAYNMNGYNVGVTAVYDEGESYQSNKVKVYVTGETSVAGNLYELDGTTPVQYGVVTMNGVDEFGNMVSYNFPVDANGSYSGTVKVGAYDIIVTADGYQDKKAAKTIAYGEAFVLDFIMTEAYNPVKYVTATEMSDSLVQVVWGMKQYSSGKEDFETGDFSAYEWNNTVSEYPWEITTEAYEGQYAMKSTNEGLSETVSAIEIVCDAPEDGFIGFYYKISSEQYYDYGYFYVDGALAATMSGEAEWLYKQLAVTAGTHTYRWEYVKDELWEVGDDAFYIDNIEFFKKNSFEGGWLHYDDGVLTNAIGMGTASPVYWGVSFPASENIAGYTLTKIALYDFDQNVGNFTANIYLGGETAPGTLVSTQDFAMSGTNTIVEVELDTHVVIDGTQTLWITLYCDELPYPCTGSSYSNNPNSDWYSFDGVEWKHALDANAMISWILRGYLEKTGAEKAILARETVVKEFTGGVSTGELVAKENVASVNFGIPSERIMSDNNGTRAFDSYNLYMTNVFTGDVELVAEKTVDTAYNYYSWLTQEAGVYQWGVSVSYEGNRQMKVLYQEDFESGVMPTGWTTINKAPSWYEEYNGGAATTGQWYVGDHITAAQYYSQSYAPAYGSYAAYSSGYYPYGEGYEYYLVTPALNIKPASTLSFQYTNPIWDGDIQTLNVCVSSSPTGPWTELWTTGDTYTSQAESEWKEVALNMDAYAGETVYFAFVNLSLDQGFGVAVDNVTLSIASTESPIVWSKPVDKDMMTEVVVSAETNNGDPVRGAVVTFTNVAEEGVEYTAIIDHTGVVTFDSFRKGVYEFNVSKKGYSSSVSNEVVEIWSVSEFNVLLAEKLEAVEGLYVSPTGWAMWDNKVIGAGDEFEFSFEDGMEGWTTIDANGDGHIWYHSTESGNHSTGSGTSHSGEGHILSESFCLNDNTPIAPDDYVVVPFTVEIGETSVFSFWASALDNAWSSEHFGVAVSTTGNTSADDFETIAEWTIGRQTEWTKYEVDMSDYAGVEVWIAIRHFAVYDNFILAIDDVALTNVNNSKALVKYQIMLDGVVEADSLLVPYYQHENLVDGTQYTTSVVATYTMGESVAMEYTWTKAAEEMFAGVSDLSANIIDDKAVLSWTLPEVEEGPTPTAYSYGFEGGMEGWTFIDADGDGYNWTYNNDTIDMPAHTGNSCVFSESFHYGFQIPLYPDNYMVSPIKIEATKDTKVSLWACAQHYAYPSEHFGVAVSTERNNIAADFTTVAEWTIAGKKRQTEWIKYEADLSEYAGQEIWVAIRHFNVSDMYIIVIDDVEIYVGEGGNGGGNDDDDDDDNDDSNAVTTFICDFENGMEGWSTLDADNDGHSWEYSTGNDDAYSGSAYVYSESQNRIPDNYLVMPEKIKVKGGTKVNFWARAQDSGSPDEFFSVCVSTNDNPTSPSDFVTVAVWLARETKSGWNQYGAYLAEYAGQEVWIAFRHYNCYDEYRLNIDDVEVFVEEEEEDENRDDDATAIAEVLGVMIYRNGDLITNKPVQGEMFTDNNGVEGDEYCVKVVYGGEKDVTYYAMSDASCAETVYEMPCVAPKSLYGEMYAQGDQFGALLTWPYEDEEAWMYYDNGTYVSALGTGEYGNPFYWGVMYPAATVSEFAGRSITMVSMFDCLSHSGTFFIFKGGNNSPGTLVYSQAYSTPGCTDFVRFELASPVSIEGTENIWVVFRCNQGASFPAAHCDYTGDPNGSWISLDGNSWSDVSNPDVYGDHLTWMIRTYAGFAKGESAAVESIELDNIETNGKLMSAGERGAKAPTLDHYNIYRGTNANNFQLIGESEEGSYFDAVNEEGTYYYQVTALYVENGEECESEPATAYGNAEQNYVVVDVVSIDENGVNGMMIYPNPTKGALNINVEGMTNITITNALGQVMYDSSVATDNVVVDMAQYEAGVYMVRITTEAGVAVERITVVK